MPAALNFFVVDAGSVIHALSMGLVIAMSGN
jgi:hypothetical protein